MEYLLLLQSKWKWILLFSSDDNHRPASWWLRARLSMIWCYMLACDDGWWFSLYRNRITLAMLHIFNGFLKLLVATKFHTWLLRNALEWQIHRSMDNCRQKLDLHRCQLFVFNFIDVILFIDGISFTDLR